MVWVAPVVKDNMAFLSCQETQSSDGHHLPSPRTDSLHQTHLENAAVVHVLQGEGETLRQHSVKPALQDGGDAEPVERELQTDHHRLQLRLPHSHPAGPRAVTLTLMAAACATSDLEDDEVGLLHFLLLVHDVPAEAVLLPGAHGLVSVLEQLWMLQLPWRMKAANQVLL